MQTAVLALVIACIAWVLAMRDSSQRVEGDARSLQFWWAAALFATGGIGSLASFEFVTIGPDEVTLLRMLPLIAVGGLIVISSIAQGRAVMPLVAFILAPYFLLLLLPAISGGSVFMPALSGAAFLPVLLIPREGYDLRILMRGARFGIAATLLTVAIGAATSSQLFIGPCRFDKCSIWGLSLGTVGTGNALGMVLAVSAVVALIAARRFLPFVIVGVSSWIVVDLTSSRSAFYGFLAGLGVAVAYKLTIWRKNRTWVYLALLTAAVVVVAVPLQGWTADEFTGRAALWTYALQLFRESPLIGYGASFWVSGTGADGIHRNYATHNFFTESLISSGALGTALLVAAIIVASRGRSFESSAVSTAMFAAVLAASITEVVSAPGRTYLFAGAIVFAFVVSQSERREPLPLLAEKHRRNTRADGRYARRPLAQDGLGVRLRSTHPVHVKHEKNRRLANERSQRETFHAH